MSLFPRDSTITLRLPVKPKYLLLLKLLPYFLTTTAHLLKQALFCRSFGVLNRRAHFFPIAQGAASPVYLLLSLCSGWRPWAGPSQVWPSFCCNVEADSLFHVADWIRVVCPFRGSNVDLPSHSRAVTLSPIPTSWMVSTSLPFTSAFQICFLLFLGGLSLFHLSSP